MFSSSRELSKVYQRNKILITTNIEKISNADSNLSEIEKLLKILEVGVTSLSVSDDEKLKWDGEYIYLSRDGVSIRVLQLHYKTRININKLLPDFLEYCLNQIEKL